MRRLLTLLVVAAAAIGAALLPAPEPAAAPLQDLIIEPPGLTSPQQATIWYCPWAQSSAYRDSVLAVASLQDATASFTFPVTIRGEPPDPALVAVRGRGAATLDLGSVAQRGDSPGFVEFAGGPSATSVTVMGDAVLAADACVSSGPATWYFPGGSTMSGEHLTLRIFNPFPDVAKVTVTAVSDIGVEALGELENIPVGAHSWRDVSFESLLRERQNLVVAVTAVEGVVVPAMDFGNDADEDWWPGVGEATAWEFPVARVQGTPSFLVVDNPGLGAVDVSVDLYTPDGVILDAFSATLDPDTPTRFDLSQYPGDPLGARVGASGPVVAAVVAQDEDEVAVMAGEPAAAQTWLLPGARRLALHATSVWLLNTDSEEAISATVSALTPTGTVGETVVVPPGVPTQVDVVDLDAEGYLVEASAPVTVAWTVRGPTGLAFASASPVDSGGE
jgi:hypothetical protein